MRPAYVRVSRCGVARVIHCGPRPTQTVRLPCFTAHDIATAWIAEYLAIRAQEVSP